MALQQNYTKIIDKIENGKPLEKEEKAVVKEAVDRWLTENAVIANGIVSLVKLTADRGTFSKIKSVVESAKKRAEDGKEPLTADDKKKLYESLGYLRKESSDRIGRSIENGSILFLAMLHNELNKVDVEELKKLQRILGTLK
jgi:hypothetical protein